MSECLIVALVCLGACSGSMTQPAKPETSVLPSGTYHLDVRHLTTATPDMSPAMLSKLEASQLRLTVTKKRAKLDSKGAPPDQAAPTFTVIVEGKNRILLQADHGPVVPCVIPSPNIIDCDMPHGLEMRFRHRP
jgi:hypothetical protein